MLTIEVHNNRTGTNENANYHYYVCVNGNEIARGSIMGHNRSNGWTSLISLIIEQQTQKDKEIKKTCPNCGKEHGNKDNNYCSSCIDKLAKMRMDTYIDDDGRFARYKNSSWRCPECDAENADDLSICECGYSKSRRK